MTRPISVAAFVAILVVVGPGCGGGGGGGAGGLAIPGGQVVSETLRIDELGAAALPLDQPIEPLRLTVDGVVRDDVTWRIDSGSLPPGVLLQPDGRLTGTPTVPGVYAFEVHASSGHVAGVKGLALAFDSFGIHVTEGLLAGEAIEGRMLELRAAGATLPVTYSVTGPAAWAERDAATGRARLLPGARGTGPADLEIWATDAAGRQVRLSIPLRPDVTAGFEAEWGTTDVWHLDFDVRLGIDHHGHAIDFQAALAMAGLRSAQSTDVQGTPADRLAQLCVQVEVHRAVNACFLRERSGAPGPTGLPISFAFAEPGSGYMRPTAGSYVSGGPNRFSVIALGCGTQGGVVGTAFVDDGINSKHENDTSHPGLGEYGVFLNIITPHFNATWANYALPRDPIGTDDIETLRAILYDEPVSGTRAYEIARIVRGFGRSLAVVAAHEIGHSLGLRHTDPVVPGSLMNAEADIRPSANPQFLPSRIDTLRAILPGPGRRLGLPSASALKASLPGGGVAVCEPDCCNLVLR